MADAIAVAGAAQVVTAPLVAAISGRFSLVAVVANLVVAPVIAPITVLGTAAAVLAVCWPAGAQLLIRFTGPEVWWVLRVAHWAAGVPGASVPVPSGVAGLVVVGCTTVLVVVMWRWRWFRVARLRCRGRRWLLVGLVGVRVSPDGDRKRGGAGRGGSPQSGGDRKRSGAGRGGSPQRRIAGTGAVRPS